MLECTAMFAGSEPLSSVPRSLGDPGSDSIGGETATRWTDQILECGFSVASAPITSCVTVNPNYYGTGENYLWLEDALWLEDGVRGGSAWLPAGEFGYRST